LQVKLSRDAEDNKTSRELWRIPPSAGETVSQLFFDKRILEKDKKARESFL